MMRTLNICCLAIFLLALWSIPASAQTKPEPQTDPQDVVRVETSLVQTDVMVFDKKGKFVDGLKPEQFQLKIDNKPQEISFFERIASGIQREQRNPQPTVSPATNPTAPPAPVAQGRVVIFFVDDFHLAPDSLVRTRKALLEFIDHGM